jgi:hypothetical protein
VNRFWKFFGVYRFLMFVPAFGGCDAFGDPRSAETERRSLALSGAGVVDSRLVDAFIADCVADVRANAQQDPLKARVLVEPRAREALSREGFAFDVLRSRLSEAACSPASRLELATYSYLMNALPKAASIEGIGCILASSPSEDIVRWDAIDAWIQIGKPKSLAIEEARRTAVEFGTQRRFLSPSEVARILRETPPSRVIKATIITDDGDKI